jgi:hypothetical protein
MHHPDPHQTNTEAWAVLRELALAVEQHQRDHASFPDQGDRDLWDMLDTLHIPFATGEEAPLRVVLYLERLRAQAELPVPVEHRPTPVDDQLRILDALTWDNGDSP